MPRLVVLGILIVARLSLPASGSWYQVETKDLAVSDSVRIRAVPSQSSTAYGPGTASDPVNLRSPTYQYKSQKPYEWFLKFNLASYAGRHITSATLSVSKCEASSGCKSSCVNAGKCNCATAFFSVEPSCGGGNILDAYSASSDDLHVWHVPSTWDNNWKFSDWSQTWDGTTQAGVMNSNSGTGGSSKFDFATYITGTSVVGQTGTAVFDVVTAMGTLDYTVEGARYTVAGGDVSLRLTATGTTSRFFVPQGGDAGYVPVLTLGLTNSTGTTTTTTTSTTTSTTTLTTNSTSTTNTSTSITTSTATTNTTITTNTTTTSTTSTTTTNTTSTTNTSTTSATSTTTANTTTTTNTSTTSTTGTTTTNTTSSTNTSTVSTTSTTTTNTTTTTTTRTTTTNTTGTTNTSTTSASSTTTANTTTTTNTSTTITTGTTTTNTTSSTNTSTVSTTSATTTNASTTTNTTLTSTTRTTTTNVSSTTNTSTTTTSSTTTTNASTTSTTTTRTTNTTSTTNTSTTTTTTITTSTRTTTSNTTSTTNTTASTTTSTTTINTTSTTNTSTTSTIGTTTTNKTTTTNTSATSTSSLATTNKSSTTNTTTASTTSTTGMATTNITFTTNTTTTSSASTTIGRITTNSSSTTNTSATTTTSPSTSTAANTTDTTNTTATTTTSTTTATPTSTTATGTTTTNTTSTATTTTTTSSTTSTKRAVTTNTTATAEATTTHRTTTTTTTTAAEVTTSVAVAATTVTTTTSLMVVPMVVSVTQVFALLVGPTVDLVAAVSRPSFLLNCQMSAAYALGKDAKDVMVLSVALAGDRRLAGLTADAAAARSRRFLGASSRSRRALGASSGSNIIFRYNVVVKSLDDLNVTIVTSQNVEFSKVFGKQLTWAEQALPQGLRVDRFSFVRTSTAAAVRLGTLQQSPNRTAEGQVLDLFGSPDWRNSKLQSWATSAAPAVQAALVNLLSIVTPSISGMEYVIIVTPALFEMTSSYMQVQFDIFVQVPPVKRIADDPDGRVYQDRVQSYAKMLASLTSSTVFASFLPAELLSRGVPELPGMSFSKGSFASPAGYSGSTAGSNSSEMATASGSIALLVFGLLCFFGVQCHRKPAWRRLGERFCAHLCPCCCEKKTPFLGKAAGMSDDRVKPFHLPPSEEKARFCKCGSFMDTHACVCHECNRKAGDFARERYVESRTMAVLGNALKEFNQAPSLRTSSNFNLKLSSKLGDDQKALLKEASALRFALGGTFIEHPGAASSMRMVQSFRSCIRNNVATELSLQPEPEPDLPPASFLITSADRSPNRSQNPSSDQISPLSIGPLTLASPPATGRSTRQPRHPFSPDSDSSSGSDMPEVSQCGTSDDE